MIQTRAEFRFDNPVLVPGQGIFTPYFQRALSGLAILLNQVVASRNTGVTAAIASGATVAHGMAQTPKVVLIQAQDGTPTNYFVDQLTTTSFRINYTGGGTHSFAWVSEL